MREIFWVDLPNPHEIDGEWINIETFDTRKDAITFCQMHFGADSKGRIDPITAGEEDEEKDEE